MESLPFNVVWLCGLPRSGTSWVSQIFDSVSTTTFRMAPLFSYAFKNAVNEDSSNEEWQDFFVNVYNSKDAFLLQEERRKKGDFPLTKDKARIPEHLVIKDVRYHEVLEKVLELPSKPKVVYIVRNPCAAIYSWLKSAKEFPKDADPLEEWYTGDCRKINRHEYWGFKDWLLLTKKYLRLSEQYPDQVYIAHYDKMVLNPLEEVSKLLKFSNLEMDENTKQFLLSSNQKNDTSDYSVFKDKSVVTKWKGKLHPKIEEEIKASLSEPSLAVFLDENFQN